MSRGNDAPERRSPTFAGSVAGTLWHGLLENDAFRRDYLAGIAHATGRRFTVAPGTSFAAIRETKLDRLANLLSDNLDREAIHRLLDGDRGAPPSLRLALEPTPRRATPECD